MLIVARFTDSNVIGMVHFGDDALALAFDRLFPFLIGVVNFHVMVVPLKYTLNVPIPGVKI
jgi:hypothetical protein